MSVEIPEVIRAAMAAKGIKNLRQLTLRMSAASSAVHRLFSGQNKHTTLKTYKKIAESCGWTLEQFFFIANDNDPDNVAQFIRGRLYSLNISNQEFTRYLSDDTNSGGAWLDYLDGSHKYDRLNLYWSLKSVLGITADTMYESLIMSESLTKLRESGILSSSANERSESALTNDLVRLAS